MGVVVFDYAAWTARYPEFASVSEDTAQLYFNEAGLYCDNTDQSIVQDIATRTIFLNMLTAHLAALYGTTNGVPNSTLVGRINSAGEGSVNVSAELNLPPGSAAWFSQTKYGLSYWQASSRFRSMRYRPGPQPFFQPPWPYTYPRRF